MGIPLVWEPSTGRNNNSSSSNDTKTKPDPSSSAERHHRSAIRRSSNRHRSAVVPIGARYPAPPSPLSREEPWNRGSAERDMGGDRRDHRIPADPTAANNNSTTRAATTTTTTTTIPPLGYFGDWPPLSASTAGLSSGSHGGHVDRGSSSTSSRRDIGQQILRDSLRHASPGRRLRLRRDPTVHMDLADALGVPGRDWLRHPAAPSPSAPAPESTRNGRTTTSRVSFTPRFAPAHPMVEGGEGEAEERLASTTPPPPPPLPRENHRPSDAERHVSEVDMPLLRGFRHPPVVHASGRTLHPHPLIDGLGDRERSFGPEEGMVPNQDDDDEEDDMHDTWETLLTTIQPDEQLPSAHSSFDSATATASSALSRGSGLTNSMNSSASSRTTAPLSFEYLPPPTATGEIEVVDPFPLFTPNCDFISEGSDTEADSDQEEPQRGRHSSNNNNNNNNNNTNNQSATGTSTSTSVARHRRRQHVQPDPRGGRRPDPPPSQRHRPGQPESTARSTRTTMTASTPSFRADNLPSEIQQMHAILHSLVRRDDIPDEWWETAGLSRTIRRELNNDNSNSNSNSGGANVSASVSHDNSSNNRQEDAAGD